MKQVAGFGIFPLILIIAAISVTLLSVSDGEFAVRKRHSSDGRLLEITMQRYLHAMERYYISTCYTGTVDQSDLNEHTYAKIHVDSRLQLSFLIEEDGVSGEPRFVISHLPDEPDNGFFTSLTNALAQERAYTFDAVTTGFTYEKAGVLDSVSDVMVKKQSKYFDRSGC